MIRAARSGRGTLEVFGLDGQGRHEKQTFSVRLFRKVFFELDYTDSIFCILIQKAVSMSQESGYELIS